MMEYETFIHFKLRNLQIPVLSEWIYLFWSLPVALLGTRYKDPRENTSWLDHISVHYANFNSLERQTRWT